MPLSSFSLFIVLARKSSIELTLVSDNEEPCLVPGLKWNASFSIKCNLCFKFCNTALSWSPLLPPPQLCRYVFQSSRSVSAP